MVTNYKKGNIELTTVKSLIQSWIGHVKHVSSSTLRKELMRNAVFIKPLHKGKV